jgi:hypothetical protein
VEIEVPRDYTGHAPRNAKSTSTSFPADNAFHALTACIEVALNDNGVNCDLPVGSQVVGGCEVKKFCVVAEGTGYIAQVEELSFRLSTPSNPVLGSREEPCNSADVVEQVVSRGRTVRSVEKSRLNSPCV